LKTNKQTKAEPDMTINDHDSIASRDSGALAGGMGAGPHEQPQLFNLPQTQRTSDDYWTPSWVFAVMAVEFDLDVASPPGGSPWVPARHYYTQEDDGLSSPWYGRVWMNPPYSNSTPWVDKFMHHRNGICLVPFAKARWTNRLWETADAIVMNDSRFKFEQGSIFMPTLFAAFGKENVEAIKRLGHSR
jgi:phage N-6-adenine-methyltransferase